MRPGQRRDGESGVPTLRPLSGKGVPVSDGAHPGFAKMADVADVLRTKSGRLASLFERAALVESSERRLVVGVVPQSFEAGLAEAQAREVLREAMTESLGVSSSLELVEIEPGQEFPTLAKMVGEAVRARREEVERAIRAHPLVTAAVAELGAEIRDVKLPADLDAVPISLQEARGRATNAA